MTKKNSAKPTIRLKPGNHAFVPGAHAAHNNENTSSEELHWYLAHYPHIKDLIEQDKPETNKQEDINTDNA